MSVPSSSSLTITVFPEGLSSSIKGVIFLKTKLEDKKTWSPRFLVENIVYRENQIR